jgi:transposase
VVYYFQEGYNATALYKVKDMKKYQISECEYEAAKALARKNKNKNIEKRLQVIILRYEGLKDLKIAEKTGYHHKRVSQLCAEFAALGIEEYARNKYGGNHRSLSEQEETEVLAKFKESAANGQIVTGLEIKAAFDERIGRDTGRGYIYMLLERHGWRKVMPRGKHPKKADDEVIDSSKKLTLNTRK